MLCKSTNSGRLVAILRAVLEQAVGGAQTAGCRLLASLVLGDLPMARLNAPALGVWVGSSGESNIVSIFPAIAVGLRGYMKQ